MIKNRFGHVRMSAAMLLCVILLFGCAAGGSDMPSVSDTVIDTEIETEEATAEVTEAPVTPIAPSDTKVTAIRTAVVLDGKLDAVFSGITPAGLAVATCMDNYANNRKGVGTSAPFSDFSLAEGLTDDDFSVSYYFGYDDSYLYMTNLRIDSTPIYSSDTFREPYAGDGDLIWFTVDGKLTGGIQWSIRLSDTDTPVFGYFTNDDQTHSVRRDGWEYGIEESSGQVILEAAVPLSDLGLTAEMLEAGRVGMTLCVVDMINSAFDGNCSKLWAGYAYELWYPGVNDWAAAPEIETVPADK